MSLHGVESSSGYLKCVQTDGTATAKKIELGDDDYYYNSVQNIVGNFRFDNISESDTADILKTSELIEDGDALVLVKQDDSTHLFQANGVTGTGPYELDVSAVTQGEIPSKAYRVNERLKIGKLEPAFSGDTYEMDGDRLKAERTFDGGEVDRWSYLEPEVLMSAVGNRMIDLSFDTYKKTIECSESIGGTGSEEFIVDNQGIKKCHVCSAYVQDQATSVGELDAKAWNLINQYQSLGLLALATCESSAGGESAELWKMDGYIYKECSLFKV